MTFTIVVSRCLRISSRILPNEEVKSMLQSWRTYFVPDTCVRRSNIAALKAREYAHYNAVDDIWMITEDDKAELVRGAETGALTLLITGYADSTRTQSHLQPH
jgi:hypothetical protein